MLLMISCACSEPVAPTFSVAAYCIAKCEDDEMFSATSSRSLDSIGVKSGNILNTVKEHVMLQQYRKRFRATHPSTHMSSLLT